MKKILLILVMVVATLKADDYLFTITNAETLIRRTNFASNLFITNHPSLVKWTWPDYSNVTVISSRVIIHSRFKPEISTTNTLEGDSNRYIIRFIEEPVVEKPRVRWQHDDIREQIKRREQQVRASEEFSRTNTNPNLAMLISGWNTDWRPEKGDIELGYCDDGSVLWRPLPEAPK